MTCSPEPSKERGFSKYLEVKCSQCRFTSGVYSSPTVEKHRIGRKTFEGNLLAAASFSESGGGYSAMQKFSQVFSAGALSENAYRRILMTTQVLRRKTSSVNGGSFWKSSRRPTLTWILRQMNQVLLIFQCPTMVRGGRGTHFSSWCGICHR